MQRSNLKFLVNRALCSLFVLCLPLAAQAAPGDLDPSFGTGGKRVLAYDFGGDNIDRAFKIIVDGSSSYVIGDASTSPTSGTTTITRLQSNGQIDGSYGVNGTVKVGDLNGAVGWLDLVNGALQTDGKLVLVGRGNFAGNTDMLACRFNASGARDLAFGAQGNGCRRIGFDLVANGHDAASAVAIQPNGSIVIAGAATWDAKSASSRMAIARLTSTGFPDFGFGVGGKTTVAFDHWKSAWSVAMAVDPSGRILIAGNVEEMELSPCDMDFAAVRLLSNGTLDTQGFSGGKFVQGFDLGPTVDGCDYHTDYLNGMALQADGSILLGGSASFSSTFDFAAAVMKLKPNGTLDPTFGNNGRVFHTACDVCLASNFYAFKVQPDGKMLLGGATIVDGFLYDFVIMRLTPNGQTDDSFQGGHTFVSFDNMPNESSDFPFSIGLQFGRPIIVGTKEIGTSSDIAIVRLQN